MSAAILYDAIETKIYFGFDGNENYETSNIR